MTIHLTNSYRQHIFVSLIAIMFAVRLYGASPGNYLRHTITHSALEVEGPGFSGYIFPEGYLWYPYDDETDNQFRYRYYFATTLYTPTSEDVWHAEEIIDTRLMEYAKNTLGYVPDCLVHLNDYKRQYLGLVKSDKTKRLYVNLISKEYAESWGNTDTLTADAVTCRNCYVSAVAGCAPGECTIAILIDLIEDRILVLSL